MVILYFVMERNLTTVLEAKAIRDMSVIAADRAELVESYISGCCEFLSGYGKALQIREVLNKPKDPEALAAARSFTNMYSAGRENLEGLYVAEWDTYVLAHINPDSMDKTFRAPESAKELETLIRKQDRSFCTGIVLAPVTQQMVIPVYAPVYDDSGEMIGFVGAAFFTGGLSAQLESLAEKNAGGNMGYSLVNASSNVYIFDEKEEYVGQEIKDDELMDEIRRLKADGKRGAVSSFIRDDRVSVCFYMADRDWVFVVTDNNEDVFGIIRTVRTSLIIVCLVITAFMVMICMYSLRRQMKPLQAINSEIIRLKSNDFSQAQKLERYCALEDEFGTIANAVKELHVVLENQYELFREMFEMQMAGTLVTKADNLQIVMINQKAMELYGISPDKRAALTMDDIKARFEKDQLAEMDAQLEEGKDQDEELTCEVAIRHDDGKLVHILMHAKRAVLSSGELVMIFSLMDISAQKRLEANLLVLSETDYLTSLCNRRSGEARIENALREGRHGLFCLFDANKFKHVNDTFGHSVGDKVLIGIADTMRKSFRSSDVLIRLGGDEFVIFAVDVPSREIGEMLIMRFMENIAKIRLDEMNGEGITVSLGALFVNEDEGFTQMYNKADSLMYHCKKKGGNAFVFYEDMAADHLTQ